ncbi:conserved hypothetical protein [Vibrio phage 242E40-1]|nr:conserved hypothetical protein [Vibrio phage 242E40-1]
MSIIRLPINYSNSSFNQRRVARERYAELQWFRCHYCGKPLAGSPSRKVLNSKINYNIFPKDMFKSKIHLHHCRKTGMTIGAVHSRCNAYLWQYKGK